MTISKSILTLEQAQNLAPSAFTADRACGLSKRYQSYCTADVIKPVLEDGWKIVQAGQSSSRDPENRFFRQHLLRLSRPDLQVNSEYRIDALITNSNDGLHCFKVELGVYRWICCNGCVDADEFDAVSIRHVYPQEKVREACEMVAERAPKIAKHIDAWKAFELSEDQAVALAQRAVQLRWGDKPLADVNLLNTPRRESDLGSDLWHTFNRIQESIVRGGQAYVNRQGQSRRVREVKSISGNLKLNRRLWHAAETLFNGGDPLNNN